MNTPILAGNTPRWRVHFEVASTVVMLVLAATFLWQNRTRVLPPPPPPEVIVEVPKNPIKIGTAPVLGNRSAPVAIVEFADFECPACAKFTSNVEPALRRDYIDNGRVAIVFKNFPLAIHPEAKAAAAAAWCAGEQGRFWEAHDWLFTGNQHRALAGAIGLDLPTYNGCFADARSMERVESERVEGEALKIRATPTFFLGKLTPDGLVQVTDAMKGAGSLQRFKTVLDRLLQ
jgi:protein-disulfide isomerase